MQTTPSPSNNLPVQLPEAFSSVFGLGAPVAFFPASRGARWGSLSAGLLFLLGAFAATIFGVFSTFANYQKYGPAVIGRELTPPLIIAAIAFAIGAGASWSAYSNWNRAVAVYTNGLAANDNKGLQTWRWEEVDQFYAAITRHYTNGVYTGTTYIYTLRKADNSKLVFDNKYNKVQDLGQAIEQAVTPTLYKRAADAYNAGHTVSFGSVAISKEGVTIGKKVYPWAEVAQVSINQGYIRVSKKDGGWFSGASAAASTIPNLNVLLSIIDQITGVKTGK
jgi:hypothetical protein